MTTCCMPTPIPLYRPFWQRWIEAAGALWQRMALRRGAADHVLDLREAMAMNDATLRDIGAPDWLKEQAATRREMEAMALRVSHGDLGGMRW